MAGVKAARRTRRAARCRDALQIQPEQHRFALDARERHVHVVRQALVHRPVDAHVGNRRRQAADKPIAQESHPRRVLRQAFFRQLNRLAQADDARQILRARAVSAFLRAAMNQRVDFHALADVQRTDALRPVELVRREGEHVRVERFDIQRNCANRLHRVRVEEYAAFMAERANLRDGFERADFVVRRHHADQHGVRAQGVLHLLDGHEAVRIHREIRHLPTLRFQPLAGVQDGVMLNLRGDDVSALLLMRKRRALERPVVALRSARGEIDFLRAAPQCRCDLPPRALDRLFRIPPRRMNGRRVAIHLHIIRKHCLHHGLRNGGRRRVIQINTIHVCSFLFAFSFWKL